MLLQGVMGNEAGRVHVFTILLMRETKQSSRYIQPAHSHPGTVHVIMNILTGMGADLSIK